MRLLITGKNSYIGNSLSDYLRFHEPKVQITHESFKTEAWKKQNFSEYDAIFHVAGIAHSSNSKKMDDLYFKVNRDLTVEIAEKAKRENVKHFIFMSSIIIFDRDNILGDNHEIDIHKNNPQNAYAQSKLEAEKALLKLENESFKISIIRAPMVFGPNSKGNFPKLLKISKYLRYLPNLNNERSVLYIDNLNELIRQILKSNQNGIYHPQNKRYLNTIDVIKKARFFQKKKTYSINILGKLLLVFKKNHRLRQIFGSKKIPIKMSNHFNFQYQKVSLNEALDNTIKAYFGVS